MLRVLPLLVIALALVAFVCQPALADKTHEGTVVKVDGTKLTMTDKDKKEHSHTIPADAKVTLDGKAAKLADLKAGTVITVTTSDDGKIVKSIVAKTK